MLVVGLQNGPRRGYVILQNAFTRDRNLSLAMMKAFNIEGQSKGFGQKCGCEWEREIEKCFRLGNERREGCSAPEATAVEVTDIR